MTVCVLSVTAIPWEQCSALVRVIPDNVFAPIPLWEGGAVTSAVTCTLGSTLASGGKNLHTHCDQCMWHCALSFIIIEQSKLTFSNADRQAQVPGAAVSMTTLYRFADISQELLRFNAHVFACTLSSQTQMLQMSVYLRMFTVMCTLNKPTETVLDSWLCLVNVFQSQNIARLNSWTQNQGSCTLIEELWISSFTVKQYK